MLQRPYPLFLSLIVLSGLLSAEPSELGLNTAIASALEQNLGLRIATYTPANAVDSIVIEEAAFDTELFGSTSRSETQAAAANSSLDSSSAPESEYRTAETGVTKLFSTGATATLDTGIDRSSSNNNAARNPDYSTEVGISITQPLLKDAWSTINLAPLARSKVTAERTMFELRSEILDLILETEIAYWNLSYARADLVLNASNLSLAENLLEENRERERLGLLTSLEVLQAEAEVLAQQESMILAERAIENAEDELRYAMGQANFLESLTESIIVAELPETMDSLRPLKTVIQETVLNDVDAKAQERRIEVERINKILAENEMLPDLDLTAGVSYLGRNENGSSAYRGAYSADGYDWNVGLEISMPWGFREARARTRQASRNLQQAELELYNIKQQKALAARIAWRSASSGLKRIEVTRSAMILNQNAFEQERARYGAGLVSYRNLLEAQRDLDQAKRNYLSAVIETLRANVRLSRVDGTILARNGLDWNTVEHYTEVTTPASDFLSTQTSATQ
jgi:outer membrane protein TolC